MRVADTLSRTATRREAERVSTAVTDSDYATRRDMAAIENLEIVVDVDIGSALAALEDLQDELRDLAESIEAVDARGSEGIDIDVDLHGEDAELAALKAKIEAFEAQNDIDLGTDINRDLTGPGFQTLSSPTAAAPGELAEGMDWLFGDDARDFSLGGLRAELDMDFGDGRLSRTLSSLSDTAGDAFESLNNFDLRMSDIHNMLARLVPLLIIFIGAIPAAVTALIGLAAAAVAAAAGLAALTGLGALGVGLQGGDFDMQRLSDVWTDIRDSFIEAFAPLAERLEPLFLDAVDGLERMFQAIANQGDALMELTDEARAFGGFLMDFVPGALRTLGALVEALAPIFGDIGRFLKQNFESIVRTLVNLTAQAVPVIADLGMKIAKALPAIVKMSIGFAQIASIIIGLIGIIGKFLGLFGITPRLFGLAAAAALAFASALLLARTQIIRLIIEGIVKLATAIFSYLFPSIASAIISMFGLSAATLVASAALAAFITLATLGAGIALVGMATSAAAGFLGLAGSIDSATSSLKDFNRVSGRSGSDGFNPYGAGEGGAGAADVGAGPGAARAGGKTVINIESSGDPDEDASNARYAGWRKGRTTGGNN